jgi:hypothetical protein
MKSQKINAKIPGNNAASINIKKARFFLQKNYTGSYGLDTELEHEPAPEPNLSKVGNRNK